LARYLLYTTAETLGIQATFSTLPNLVLITFETPLECRDLDIFPSRIQSEQLAISLASPTTETITLPLKQGSDMGRLFQTSSLCKSLAQRDIPLEIATEHLDKLLTSSDPLWWWCNNLSGFVATVAISGLLSVLAFRGSWYDMVGGTFLAILSQLIHQSTLRFRALRPIEEAIAAFFVGFVGLAIYFGVPLYFNNVHLCYTAMVLPGILDYMPGMVLCTSFVELTTSHIISGSTRLISGMVKALLLAFGLATGYKAYFCIIGGNSDTSRKVFLPCDISNAPSSLPNWIGIAIGLVLLNSLSVSICYKASPRQFPIMILSSFTAYWVSTTFELGTLIVHFSMLIHSNV
jgi:uncharacterized membrane protein YjjP (DUF1212 family)